MLHVHLLTGHLACAGGELVLRWSCGRHERLGNVLLITFQPGKTRRFSRAAGSVGKVMLSVGKATGAVVLGTVALAACSVIG
jgi:hypothetical protein